MGKKSISIVLTICIIMSMFPLKLFASEQEATGKEPDPAKHVSLISLKPVIEEKESQTETDMVSETMPEEADSDFKEEYGIEPQAQDGSGYYEDLKIWFNSDTGTVTDADSDIVSLDLPDTIDGKKVTSIGMNAFKDCSFLRNVRLPQSVSGIGWYAFSGCGSLEEIRLPEGLKYIGDGAFQKCTKLTSVTIPDSVTSMGTIHEIRSNTSINGMYYCGVFRGCTGLSEVSLGKNLASLGNDIFYGCTELKSIVLPDSVAEIGSNAFRDCSSLKNAVLSTSLKVLECSLFNGCTSLAKIEIPEGVTDIKHSAFLGCSSLSSVLIADSVTRIGAGYEDGEWLWGYYYYCGNVFAGCTELQYITLPETVAVFEDSSTVQMGSDTHVTGGSNFSETTVLRVKENSAAENYAKKKNQNYIYYFDEKALSLVVYGLDGKPLTEGYTVTWFAHGSEAPAADGGMLPVFNSQDSYDYEITLSESLLQEYLPPARQQAELKKVDGRYITEYTLTPRNKVTVTGAVIDPAGNPLPGAAVIFEQSLEGKYKNSVTAVTDASGAYTVILPEIQTAVSCYADGYSQLNKKDVALEGVACTLDTIQMSLLPQNRIRLSMEKLCASEESGRGKTEEITSCGGLEFSLYNQSSGKEITSFEAQYPYLYIDGAEITDGDRIRITAADLSGEMPEASASVTFSAASPASARLSFIACGSFRAEISQKAAALVFGADQKFAVKYSGRDKIESGPLPAGNYSVVIVQNTPLLSGVSELRMLDALGLKEGADYLLLPVSIRNGQIVNLGKLRVPDFNAAALRYTVAEATGCTVKQAEAAVGSLLAVRAEYRIASGHNSASEQVMIDLPDGLSVIAGSLTVDGKKSNYRSDGSRITVGTGKREAVVRFYISASDAGVYDLNAYLRFNSEGKEITQPIGTAGFTATELRINAASDTGAKSVVVSGNALPKSAVQLYDNNAAVASAVANSAGTWAVRFDLIRPGSYSKHNIYAEMTSVYGVKYRSAVHVITYDKNYCDLKRITMVHGGASVVFDSLEARADVVSYTYENTQPFSFKVEFTGDNVSDVELVVQTGSNHLTYVPCTFDAGEHCYIASYSGAAVTGVSASYKQPDDISSVSFHGTSGTVVGKDFAYKPVKKGSLYKEASEDMQYGIVDTYPKKAAKGHVTLLLDGRLFEPGLTAVLSNGSSEYAAEAVYWANHQTVYARFDLTDAPDGVYSLTAACGQNSDTLKNCLTVSAALDEGKGNININLSQTVKQGETYKGCITVTNCGYTDIYAPVLKLSGKNIKIKLSEEEEFAEEDTVFAQNKEGLAGTIAPGETASVDIYYTCARSGPFSLTVDDYSNKEGDIYGKVSLKANSGLSDILTANMLSLVGTSYREYTKNMAEMASAAGASYDGTITAEMLEMLFEEQARGDLGGSGGPYAVDLVSSGLSVDREFSNSLHRKHNSGIFGIGWDSGLDATAEYLSKDGEECILVKSGDNLSAFVKDAKKGTFVNLFQEDVTAQRDADGTIRIRRDNGICQVFDRGGALKSVTDLFGNAVNYTRQDGRVTRISTTDGDAVAFTYQNGKVASAVSELTGDKASYRYDGDYLVSVTTKYGTMSYSYDKNSIGGKRGTLTGVSYPDKTHAAYAYDSLGRLSEASDATGKIAYTYGYNEITAVDEEGKTVRECYDFLGNVLWNIDAYGNVAYAEYDSCTYLTGESYGLFGRTKYQYNENGRLTSVHTRDGNAAQYTYDTHGGIAGITDPLGRTVRYDEDKNGMLSAIVYPDGSRESYTYDKKGNLASTADANGITASYTYDNRNNLIRVVFDAGNQISYTYNQKNDLISINEDGKITSIAYDKTRGSLASITYPNGKSISYGYDSLGRRTSVTDSEGKVIRYGYNENGWLSTVYDDQEEVISYTYNKDGTLAKQQNANGTYTSYSYRDGMLSEIGNYGREDKLISRFAYTYNDDGYIRTMETKEGIWQYEYDKAGQLAKAAAPDGAVTEYAYDAVGNRISVTKGEQKTAYTANEMNQYTAVGSRTREYDAAGQLIEESSDAGTIRYEWDYLGRLVKVSTADGHVYEYEYDAFGGRSKVTADGEVTEYVNDPTGSGYALTAYSGDRVTHYLVSGGVAALDAGAGWNYYHFNHLGSTSELTDAVGSVANCYTYDQEGNVLDRQEKVKNPYTYVGAYGIMDDGNGLWYDRARYVSQESGSFISMDPAGQYYDLNLYRYVVNDAVNDDASEEEDLDISLDDLNSGPTDTRDAYKGKESNDKNNTEKRAKENEVNYKKINTVKKIKPNIGDRVQRQFETKKKPIIPNKGVTNPIEKNVPSYQELWEKQKKYRNNAQKTFLMKIGGGLLLRKILMKINPVVSALDFAINLGDAIHKSGLDFKIGQILGDITYPIAEIGNKYPVIKLMLCLSPYYPIIFAIDPSGYVYEGVASNRLEGVKATIYYEDYPKDEFGQPDESAGLQPIEWIDAEDYNETNPQFTDSNGDYGWDVPPGRWKVKFTKEGYEEYWTDWMEVPPEYTDVNINLKNLAAPFAETVNVYPDCVQVIFSQYMEIGSITAESITVQADGQTVSGTVKPIDADYDYGKKNRYARIFEFYPNRKLSGSAAVSVKDAVSYCGTQMEPYSRTSAVARKPEAVKVSLAESVEYGDTATMSINVTPKEAGKFKTIEIREKTPGIAAVSQHKLTLDENGYAEVSVTGKMPGTAVFETKVKATALKSADTITVPEYEINNPAIPIDLSECTISLEYDSTVYTGEAQTPAVTVCDGELRLEEGKDFTVTYYNNIDAGMASAVITGTGGYTGTQSRAFVIRQAKPVIRIPQNTYTLFASATEAQTISLGLSADNAALSCLSDNAFVRADNNGVVTVAPNFAGTAVITVTAGGGNYEMAEASVSVTVLPIENRVTASNITKKASKKPQSFSVQAKRLGNAPLSYRSSHKSVKVNHSGKVTIAKNFVGKAKITVKAEAYGIYKAAETTITVTVKPANIKLLSVKAKPGRKMLVKWKKDTTAAGYQIQYAANKKFKKAVTKKVAKKNKTSAVYSGLKAKKTYYVRIRTYKKVSGKTYYSSWSASKIVKIKN